MSYGPPTTLTAGKLVGGGRSLAHHEQETWMIRGALPEETAVTRVTGRRAGVVEAEAVEIVAGHHPLRLETPCPHADRCGGCDWPFVQAEDGATLKPAMAAEAIRATPDLSEAVRNAPIVASPDRYRLRARLHWDPQSGTLGFFDRRSHTVGPIPKCRILTTTALAALPALGRALGERCPAPVQVEWLENLEGTRAVVGLRPAKAGEGPLPNSWIPLREDLAEPVVGAHALSRRGARPGGWGERSVTMNLQESLEVPLGAFFQGNRHLVRALFDRVVEIVGNDEGPVWDLHAGVGFLAAAARHAGAHHLVLSEPSVVAANAAERNLPGATIHVGATAERTLGTRQLPTAATVLLDPPRSGLSRRLVDQLLERRPRRIMMMSCDVATWARDVHRLQAGGYGVHHLELLDLFPLTHHVEVLSLLAR